MLTADNELQSFTRTKVADTEQSTEVFVAEGSYGRKSVGLFIDENCSANLDLMFAVNQFIAQLKV